MSAAAGADARLVEVDEGQPVAVDEGVLRVAVAVQQHRRSGDRARGSRRASIRGPCAPTSGRRRREHLRRSAGHGAGAEPLERRRARRRRDAVEGGDGRPIDADRDGAAAGVEVGPRRPGTASRTSTSSRDHPSGRGTDTAPPRARATWVVAGGRARSTSRSPGAYSLA